MSAYLGSAPISKLYLGNTSISKLYLGTTVLWQSFPQMGVDKVGSQIISISSWVTITGRTIRSGFPDTVITSDGILIPAGVTVTLACQNTHGGSHADNAARLYNATTSAVIATSTAATTATPAVSASYTPSVDSVIVVQGFATSTLSSRDTISAGAGTFLTAIPS